ncbi:MAG: phosphoribosyl-ATP diphosphatase, partial [Leptospiraceae bacterium]|nr:phosphoribosyl-ATP diphosphatase [Leptospiraceae bacterium]
MEFLFKLESVLKERKEKLPEKSYTANLFRDGEDRILKKITEEAGEVLLASKNHDRQEIVHESADLLFH